MAVPALPTVSDICTKGLHRGGQYNPDTDQQDLAEDHFLQEVKADIMRVAANHPFLAATATTTTVRGLQRYAIPEDHNRSEELILLDGPDEWRGTAQSGTSQAIVLEGTLSETDDILAGKWLVLTGETGAGQVRQIVSFNNTTKRAELDTAWSTTPDSTTTYLIASRQKPLYPQDFDDANYRNRWADNVSTPQRATLFNQEFHLHPIPDKSTYGLVHHYYRDLSKIDEASDLFIQLLREWRSLWIQGIAAYTMQRYDDERFPASWALYQQQLQRLTTDAPQYSRCEVAR